MILQPKSGLGGHSLILGRPWLATTDAYIGFRSGNMTITNGSEVKQINSTPQLNQSMSWSKLNG
jgi:hypothetical protein